MERVSHQVPALREKVVPVPLHPTTLQWVHDHDFDLSYHLRHIRLPEGSGQQDLLDWARTQAMGGFDSRPAAVGVHARRRRRRLDRRRS